MRVLNYLLIGAGLCFSAFVTNAFEPVTTQMVWQSDLEVGPAADFLVKAEPTRVAEGPLGVSVDLRIYGQKNGKQYLAFEDKNIGTQIYGMFHTGQVDSPLIVVSTTNGRFKTVSGYHYENGEIKRGFQVGSELFPEIAIRKSGGMYVLISTSDDAKQMNSKVISYYDKYWANGDLLLPFGQRFKGLDRVSNH